MTERQKIKEFYDLQTCSERRLTKIKGIIENSKKIIGKDLTKLSITDVTKFLREVNNSKYTEWTKNDYKKIFKSFLKFQYEDSFLSWEKNKQFKDGFKCVSKKKAFNREKINKNTLIKPVELEKLLRAIPSMKWKALITLMYESAFRPCELTELKWKDLRFDDQRNLCSVRTTSPKTKDTREVPVKDCIVHLKRWRDEYEFPDRKETDWVFPNPQNREAHLSEAGIGEMMRRFCKKAKIRHLYPYMFRHSRIYFIQKKLGARIASKYAGHSLETSQIYDHLDSDDVEEAMLEKVYVTEELSQQEENELKSRVKRLEEALEKYIKKEEHKDNLVKDVAKEIFNKEFGSQYDETIETAFENKKNKRRAILNKVSDI